MRLFVAVDESRRQDDRRRKAWLAPPSHREAAGWNSRVRLNPAIRHLGCRREYDGPEWFEQFTLMLAPSNACLQFPNSSYTPISTIWIPTRRRTRDIG